MGRFAVLVRHFFGRFFDSEIVSQQSETRTGVVQAIGLLATPGLFLAFYMLPQFVRHDRPFAYGWQLILDYYFFVIYGMAVMGFVMVLEWDALFPDRDDYLALTPLPIGAGTIFAAKTSALGLFLAAFLAGANVFGAVLAPMASALPSASVFSTLPLFGAHVIAVGAGSLFTALSVGAIQGILMNALPGRIFRRVSPWVQMAVMGLLVLVFFSTPLFMSGMHRAFETGAGLSRYYPPFWFLAWYVDLLPGRPGGAIFQAPAAMARSALTISAAAFALFYLAGYGRHARRVLENIETAGAGPGPLRRAFNSFVNRWLLRSPLERATFHFIGNTILRTPKNRLLLAGYAAVGLALATMSVVRVGSKPGAPSAQIETALLAVIPLTLTFFAVSGLRAMFNFPAELRANWIFQMAGSEERAAHVRAVRKWVVVFGIAPLLPALLPLEIALRGWAAGLVHLSFALLLALLLLNVQLLWFRKIPFTCSHFPGKVNLVLSGSIYVFGFTIYSRSMATLVERLLPAPFKLAVFYAAGLLALKALAWFDRHERQADDALIYEDAPDPVVQTLEIG